MTYADLRWCVVYGWREYVITLVVAVLWVAGTRIYRFARPMARIPREPTLYFWPVAIWALASIASAINSTQSDFISDTGRILFMWIEAMNSAIVGVCVLALCFSALLLSCSQRIRSMRIRGTIFLVSTLWTCVIVAWFLVIVREHRLVPTVNIKAAGAPTSPGRAGADDRICTQSSGPCRHSSLFRPLRTDELRRGAMLSVGRSWDVRGLHECGHLVLCDDGVDEFDHNLLVVTV